MKTFTGRMLTAQPASLSANLKRGNVMNKLPAVRVTATVLCFMFASASPAYQSGAYAAEVKVLASVALASVLDKLDPTFERSTGNKLSVTYGLTADLKRRVLGGENVDVVILGDAALDDLQKQGKLAPGSVTPVASTPVSVAIRAGAPRPDISSVDAFRRALLAAKSIVFADPAKGGLSGVYFAKVLDRLGLTEQLKTKTILVPGAQAPEVVAKGGAELGIAQASEIVPVKGAELAGPLPGEIASLTVFSAGVGADSQSADAAMAFIQFLKGPAAAPTLKEEGFEPK
jgi:molybdate transport system substrate-binding protein